MRLLALSRSGKSWKDCLLNVLIPQILQANISLKIISSKECDNGTIEIAQHNILLLEVCAAWGRIARKWGVKTIHVLSNSSVEETLLFGLWSPFITFYFLFFHVESLLEPVSVYAMSSFLIVTTRHNIFSYFLSRSEF